VDKAQLALLKTLGKKTTYNSNRKELNQPTLSEMPKTLHTANPSHPSPPFSLFFSFSAVENQGPTTTSG